MDKIILVDKPVGRTSFDMVRLVKKVYHIDKVGHCGTLDPFACGLLILGINQATKILSFLEYESKEYIARIQFGGATLSYDTEKEVYKTSKVIVHDDKYINDVLSTFIGKITQKPPIYSSVQVNGVHLYDYARKNKEVEIPSREVNVYNIELLENNQDNILIKINCSKGTYIRSLGVDIANALGNDGYLTYLKRTRIGNISLDNANSIEMLNNNTINEISIEDILPFKVIDITYNKSLLKLAYHGQKLKLDETDQYVLIKDNNDIIGVYKLLEPGIYGCKRGLFNEQNRYEKLEKLK